MGISRYEYLWKNEKEKYVLVKSSKGFGIINILEKTMLVIEDSKLEDEIISKMLEHGNKVYNSISNIF